MMAQPVVSRTQRRIERKQLVLVVILILVVAAGSFSLGVMFGQRSGAGGGSENAEPPPAGQTYAGRPSICLYMEDAAGAAGCWQDSKQYTGGGQSPQQP